MAIGAVGHSAPRALQTAFGASLGIYINRGPATEFVSAFICVVRYSRDIEALEHLPDLSVL